MNERAIGRQQLGVERQCLTLPICLCAMPRLLKAEAHLLFELSTWRQGSTRQRRGEQRQVALGSDLVCCNLNPLFMCSSIQSLHRERGVMNSMEGSTCVKSVIASLDSSAFR
eukprot:SAG22_NODE_814_length_7044_cov_24.348884_1_plen_112_part_00